MSGIVIAQIQINDSSDKTITGVYTFDRDCGGTLVIPAEASFPASPNPGEIIWRIDQNTIYRRDDSNTAWIPLDSMSSTGPAGGDLDGYYPNPNVIDFTLPGQTTGSLVYYNGTNWVPLNPGTDGYFLETNGPGQIPSWTNHDALRKLIHLADTGPYEGFASGAFREVLPASNPFPTSITWYTSAAKTHKIVEKLKTYNVNKTPSTIIWKSYATDGVTVLATVTDTITYNGVFELSRTRTIS
jgi:hypothetical protein